MSNLRLIKELSISAGVSKSDITDCFNSDYKVYRVVASSILGSNNMRIDIRFISSGGSVVTGDYDNATLEFKVDSAYNEQRYTSLDYLKNISYASADNFGGFEMFVYNPFESTSYTFYGSAGYGGFVGDSGATNNINNKGIGVLKEQSCITGLSILHSNTTSGTTGRIKVYGLRVD
tara:strand:+ start:1137 stop:1664 length:528 start_codon:yes stop_codon:yes gene_type:complete